MTTEAFRAIAIDPGGTTGIVEAEKARGKLLLTVSQERLTPYGFLKFLQDKADRRTILLVEDFEFRPKSPAGLRMISAHLIGVAMAYSEFRECPLIMQKASYAKSGFYRNEAALKKAGVHVPGMPHGMDAMRHFLQWFAFGPGFKYNKGYILQVRKG